MTTETTQAPTTTTPAKARRGWTGRRKAAVAGGAVLSLVSLGLIGAGTAAMSLTDKDGYMDFGTNGFDHSTSTYAMTSDGWDAAGSWGGLLGDLKVTFTPDKAGDPVFVGVGPTADIQSYLNGVGHTTIHAGAKGVSTDTTVQGGAPKTAPAQAGFWSAKASGPGAQTFTWPIKQGNVAIAVLKADGTPAVNGHLKVAGTVPALKGIGTAVLAVGLLLLIWSIVWLIVKPVRRARRA